jgi:hypothetical protein
MESRNRFRGIDFASLCNLAGQYDKQGCEPGRQAGNRFLGSLEGSTNKFKVYSVQCVQCLQCTVFTVYSVQCTVYSVQCTVYSVQCTVCRVPVYPAEDAWVGGVGGAVGDPVGPVLGKPVLLGDGPQPAPHHRHL